MENVGNIYASGKATIQGGIISGGEVAAIAGEGTPAGVTDYSALTGKPAINGVTLVSGNNTLAALGIQAAGDYATNSGVATLLADYATKVFVSNNYAGKAAFNAHTADTDIHITSAERVAWNAKWDFNEATIKAVKVTSASSADSVAWSGILDKPTTFTPASHQHEKITHTLWNYNDAISDTTSPADICAKFNVGHGSDNALFTGIVQNATGERYLSLFWTGYGAAGLVELSKSYGSDGRLKYRVSEGWSDNGAHWAAAGYRELANIEDLTWTNIESKPTTIAGYGITDALTTSNYNSYVPTLTGTGASGTWGINISGNAATATNADNVAWTGIGNKPTTIAGYGITDAITTGNIGSQSVANSNNLIAKLCNENLNNGLWNTIRKGTGGETRVFEVYYNGGPYAYGMVLELGSVNYNHWQPQLWIDGSSNPNFYLRGKDYDATSFGAWKQIAFTDSNITGNAASATKLQTPRTIWGQSFDGTSDVNGDAHITGDLIVDGEVSAFVA